MWPFKKSTPDAPLGRVGWLVDAGFEGIGYYNKGTKTTADVKVREISQLGDKTRIKVLEVWGANSKLDKERKWELLDGTFVKTENIRFETTLPEGLHFTRFDSGPLMIVDAQDHVWVTIHPSAEGDPDEWRRNIVGRVFYALGMELKP